MTQMSRARTQCWLQNYERLQVRRRSNHCQSGAVLIDRCWRGASQVKQEHEIMLEESMDMLLPIVETTKRCAAHLQQVAATSSELDMFRSKSAQATIRAVHMEGAARHHKALAAQHRTDGNSAAAAHADDAATAANNDATLAREAAYSATWQSSSLRQQTDAATSALQTAEQLLARQASAHDQMMSAVGVAIASATLRGRAQAAAGKLAVAAAHAAEAAARANYAQAAAAEMRQRASLLRAQGYHERTELAERQCAELERDARHAADAAAAFQAESVHLTACSSAAAAQAEQAEAQTECAAEARTHMQQLSSALQALRAQHEAAAAARAKGDASAAVVREQTALAADAIAKAAQLERDAQELKADARLDEAADEIALAATWRTRAGEAEEAARREQHHVHTCGEDAAKATAAAAEMEAGVSDMQV